MRSFSEKLATAVNFLKENNFNDSLAALDGIIIDDPANAEALALYSFVCLNLSKYDEAILVFKKCISLNENYDIFKTLVSQNVLTKTQLDEMSAHLDLYIDQNNENDLDLFYISQFYFSVGNFNKSLDLLDKLNEINPNENVTERNDLKAIFHGLPKPSLLNKRPKVIICCVPGMDNFIHELISGLSPYLDISASISLDLNEHLHAISKADIVWLEWGNQMTGAISKEKDKLKGKQVIVRIHNYEVHDNLVDRIDFEAVTDIIFVSPYLRELFLGHNIKLPFGIRINVIHNAINTRRFSYIPRKDSRIHLAFLAYISYKKDPMLLIHAFAYLHNRHPEIKLHVAGEFQDPRYEIAMPQFLKDCGKTCDVIFYGHINNAHEWLIDKDYIISTSLLESQGVGLLEAMCRGCRPLLYNFPGADVLYPPNYLWTTMDDLEDRFLHGPEPKEASDFTIKHYSKGRELGSWLKVLLNQEPVDEVFDLSD
jgi:glycosyltransferase involved in cell wall biosynthesis